MRKITSVLASMAILIGLTACCCPVNFGNRPAPGPGPNPAPAPVGEGPAVKAPEDPVEKAAIAAITATRGWVMPVGGNPVTEVHLINSTATDDTLKEIAKLPRTQKILIFNAKISNQGLKHLTGLKEVTE